LFDGIDLRTYQSVLQFTIYKGSKGVSKATDRRETEIGEETKAKKKNKKNTNFLRIGRLVPLQHRQTSQPPGAHQHPLRQRLKKFLVHSRP
jgi:hypothetical protein